MSANEATLKDKIAKLLAKAERTDIEEERDAYNAQAQRLMIRWGIEEAELESAGTVKPEEIIEFRHHFTTSYAPAFQIMASAVASGMGNLRTLWATPSRKPDTNRFFYVIGHKSDVERFNILLASLLLQVTAARKKWWKSLPEYERRQYTDWEYFVALREFITAFGGTVGQRLRDAHREVDTEASPGAALVLASKQSKVNTWTEEKYPKLRKVNGYSTGSSTGRQAGREAGRKASLGGAEVGSGRRGIES